VVRATKNPLRPRNKFLTRPDAVSGEYRGKIVSRNEFFARPFSGLRGTLIALSDELKQPEIFLKEPHDGRAEML